MVNVILCHRQRLHRSPFPFNSLHLTQYHPINGSYQSELIILYAWIKSCPSFVSFYTKRDEHVKSRAVQSSDCKHKHAARCLTPTAQLVYPCHDFLMSRSRWPNGNVSDGIKLQMKLGILKQDLDLTGCVGISYTSLSIPAALCTLKLQPSRNHFCILS